MKIFKTPEEWKAERLTLTNKSIGFVPTMGALHKGHISLIECSQNENNYTIVSIYVNPTQFNNKEDFEKYPSLLEDDIKRLEKMNVDYLFLPDYDILYLDKFTYKIEETNFSKILCGAFRPGHFTGVLTVVMKLFNIIKPTKAYFGEKDYQQFQLIKGMVEAFFLDVTIVPCPIVREKDGLALSSRNLRLTKKNREKAALFPTLLMSKKSNEDIKKELRQNGFKVDYIETINKRRFGAVYLGKIRLIDNVKL